MAAYAGLQTWLAAQDERAEEEHLTYVDHFRPRDRFLSTCTILEFNGARLCSPLCKSVNLWKESRTAGEDPGFSPSKTNKSLRRRRSTSLLHVTRRFQLASLQAE